MRKKISNFRFEKFVFFLFLFALALISAKSAAAQIIVSDSGNILEIKASSTPTKSILKFLPSTSVNSFSLQAVANPAVGASTISIFDYQSSTSTFKMLNGTLNYNPSNNRIGIGMTDPGYKFDVSGTGRFTAKLMLDAAEGLGVYGIRGRTSNEQVEMYQKVSIGSPNGWGTFPQAPGGGLSVYGGANFATNNGNVGIGTTSPSAKLSVSGGNIFITDAVINSGTPHAAITKTYLDSALETYGSKWILNGSKLYASSTDWNVGIGTTAPSARLEVNGGDVYIWNNGNNPRFLVGDSASGGNWAGFRWLSASDILQIGTDTGGYVLNLNEAGNVGIGTTAPGAFRLYVNGATYTSGNLNVGGDATITGGDVSISNNNGGINFNDASAYWLKTATNWGIYWDTTANQFKFNGAGVTKASIDLDDGAAYFNGSVGIGTTTPEAKLSVSGGNIFITDAVIGSSTPHAAITKTYLDSAIQALASTTSYWAANGTHIFNTNTGNVGVGTSNPGQQLEITKNFRLPATVGTSAYGVIYKGISSFIHDFNYGLNGNGITTAGGNTFVGLNAGNFTMGSTATSFSQSSSNTGVGYYSLFANTTGYGNSALGYQSLLSNTAGHSNSALGYLSLSHNTTGYGNSALGYLSLENNTTGSNNSASGYSSLRSNTTGGGNSAFGYDSLVTNSTGFFNSAFGDEAGKLLATGGVRTTGDLGLYLGYSSKASADGTNNEIVIGALAVGNGSNSVTLGNNSIAKTVLKGNVGIGTTTPAAGLEVLTGSNYSILAGGKRVGNVAAPVTGTDAVNRNYVDSNFIASTSLATITKAFVQGGNSFGVKAILGTNDNQALGIETNGTEKMTILTNGNVGIGTMAPNSKLEIQGGPLRLTGTYLDINRSGSASSGISWYSPSYNAWASFMSPTGAGMGPKGNLTIPSGSLVTSWALRSFIENPAGYGWTFESGASTATTTAIKFEIRSSDGSFRSYGNGAINGNLGVGTANHLKRLTISADSDGDGVVIKRNNAGAGTYADLGFTMTTSNVEPATYLRAYRRTSYNDNDLLFHVGASDAMYIKSAGNVGIGTTTPTQKLHVAGDANFSDNQIHGVSAPATGTDAANRFYVDGLITELSGQIAGISSSYWSASGTNIFNNNTGNVGIGTNTPSQKLDVVGSVNVSTGYRINNIATNGKYLRGNGTNFVESSIQVGDVPTLNQNTSGYAGYLRYEDNRSISPSELAANRMKFGFTSYKNDNSSPYADFLHFNSYADVSGGNANLLVINKSGIGMRLYQQVFGTTTNFSAYKDVVLANNTPALNYLTKYASTGNSVTVSSSQVYDNGTKVGVGTTAPSHKLDVVGEGNFNSNYIHGVRTPVLGADAVNRSYVDDNFSPLASQAWRLSGSNVYTSSTAWNVGIGTTRPLTRLYVFGSARDPFVSGTDPRSIASFVGDTKDGLYIGAFADPLKGLWLQASDSNDLSVKYPLTLNPNGGNVGIGTSAPNSALHVQGSSYLNGTIKTNLTGTGSRCLHVDASGVIGTMAGDCGTSTGGDNLGNGIASSNIALGNYWLSGDGNNEGIFVNSTGNVGIGTSNPTNNLTINVPTATTTNIDAIRISSTNMVYGTSLAFGASAGPAGNRIKSVLNSASKTDLAFEVIDAEIMRIISNGSNSGLAILATTTNAAFNVGNKTKITSGGYIYNANNSRWLDLTGTTGDSLKVASDLNTTGGSLKVSGTGNSWIMGKLGIGTTNPATTAGMTIDTPVASSSILFRAAGTDRAILSFKNGFFLGKDDTTSFSYSGVSNIGIGHGALERGSGDGNIAIGEFAAYYNNAANNNIAIGNGAAQVVNTSGNIALGWQAFGSSGATGGNNIAIGVAALANGAVQKNIAIGDGALNTAGVVSYNIAIGNRGAAGSNKLYIGDLNGGVSPYTPLIYGDMTSITTGAVGIKTTNLQSGMAMTVAGKVYADDFIYSSSDERLKHDIKNLSDIDYQKILKLRPVSFTYNKSNSKGFGFIAQELEKVYPEMVETNQSDGMKSVTYDNLISPTIMAIQEQQKKIEEQETLIHILLDRVNKLENSTK